MMEEKEINSEKCTCPATIEDWTELCDVCIKDVDHGHTPGYDQW